MAAATLNSRAGAPRSPAPLRESPAERPESVTGTALFRGAASGVAAVPSAGVSARFNAGGAPGTGLPGAGYRTAASRGWVTARIRR
jgi:hypothetical protein